MGTKVKSRWSVALCLAALAACASGSADKPSDASAPVGADARVFHDARVSFGDVPIPPLDAPPIDAPLPVDASIAIDAAPPVDAASALFCNANSQCTNPGECCLIAICAPGNVVGAACFPK
jgi:hypothetical protein